MSKAINLLNKEASLIDLGKGLINATKVTHRLKQLGSTKASYIKSLGSVWRKYEKTNPNMAKGLKIAGVGAGAIAADRALLRD